MNIENFCCAAAELQNKMTQTTKMSQIYYYRAFGEETREDFLADNFFNQAQERVKVNDIIIGYYPDDEDNTLICWLKVTSNFGGKVTVEPFIADATLKEYVDSITPPLEDIFYATYGETTYSEITDALDDGKTVFCEYTIGQDVYDAVFVASKNGLYQFTHSIAYLDSGKIAGNIQTFSVDTNDDWTTDSIYLQEKLVSGTNIKTVNGNSLVGSGNIDIDALPSQTGQSGKYLTTDGTNPSWNTITIPSVDVDGKSITQNTSDELQAIGVINQNDTTTALKVWHGTQAEYDAMATHDANTRYYTDGGIDVSLLDVLYPVGSIYITTNSSCPLSTLIAGSTWVLVGQDRVLQGAGTRGVVGTTLNESLPNITGKTNTISSFLSSSTPSGAFTYTKTQTGHWWDSTNNDNGYLSFDASRSSSTYQDEAPVQPDAYLVNIYRRTA